MARKDTGGSQDPGQSVVNVYGNPLGLLMAIDPLESDGEISDGGGPAERSVQVVL